MRYERIFIYVILMLLVGCSFEKPIAPEEPMRDIPMREPVNLLPIPKPIDPLTRHMNSLSLEEKVGQLLIVAYRVDARGTSVSVLSEDIERDFISLEPGGIILFSENIQSSNQVMALIEGFQALSKVPLFVAVDEEGVLVSRLAGKIEGYDVPPSARVIGQGGDEGVAKAIGYSVGLQLRELGINVNMAPVADVDTNPLNPVIGARAFSDDPYLVAQMAYQTALGLMEAGVMPVYKHFPGHGDTLEDSHFQTARVDHSLERLEVVELVPFKYGIDEGIPAVMSAHVVVSAIDSEVPATLSGELITDLLRHTLGFDGLIITDAMEMKAISHRWTSDQAAVMAIMAGVDMILMPEDAHLAKQGIIEAVTSGQISMDQLDQAVRRVLSAKKQWIGG